MHQTTIRFGSDLWESLAAAASVEGVSVAQYVRESAVERLVRDGGPEEGGPVAATDRRRDARAPRRRPRSTPAPVAAGADVEPVHPGPVAPHAERHAALLARVLEGERIAARHTESSAAVWAQSRLARARARELRAASRALAAERAAVRATAARRGGTAGGRVATGAPDAAAPASRGRA